MEIVGKEEATEIKSTEVQCNCRNQCCNSLTPNCHLLSHHRNQHQQQQHQQQQEQQ